MLFVDESHVTVPLVRGMHAGDHNRKVTLVEHGFRLPSARDNRPLRFEEVLGRIMNVVGEPVDGRGPVKALVLVGDAIEEDIDDLCGVAGELGLLGLPAFCFHEGPDSAVEAGCSEIARLSGGASARFDLAAPDVRAEHLRAAAIYATRGLDGLRLAAHEDAAARRLLAGMTGRSTRRPDARDRE